MPLPVDKINGSLNLVIETFKNLRPQLMQVYGNIEHISKDDNSPVTKLDIMVEETIKANLASEYPEIGFHGEETEDTPSSCNATWIVDPIDGTSSFIHGLPYCTNMAGLVVDGEIVASVIFQFPTNDLYTAIKDKGAYKNGERISVKNTELNNSLVFSGSFAYRNLYPMFKPYNIGLYAPLGASGYEFTRLAEGSIQGVTKVRGGSLIHDTVPGVLLAQEAGAKIISFEDGEYRYTTLSFIIGSPNFIEIVQQNYSKISDIIS
jgi:fructose-1,6-bisphosphatase/inositol monophosphatase family enzyme